MTTQQPYPEESKIEGGQADYGQRSPDGQRLCADRRQPAQSVQMDKSPCRARVRETVAHVLDRKTAPPEGRAQASD
jgi:hypothetical protein